MDQTVYKLANRFNTKALCLFLFSMQVTVALAQDIHLNQYGLKVISNSKAYQKSILRNADFQLVDIKKQVPGIETSLQYATKNNFTNTQLYPTINTTYLRKKAASALAIVQKELNKKGLGLKIWDAYRPYTATKKMWELVKDERYAADPAKGSGHNRGVAVDLTIIRLDTKKELAMGTGFDNFTDTAHHQFMDLPTDVIQNRLLLKTTMEQAGFKALNSEWWHYAITDAKDYDLLDISFNELKKIIR